MKVLRVAALALLSATALAAEPPAAAPATVPPVAGRLFDPANLDPAVAPCTDFYAYANGGWQKRHPRPAEYSEWGRFEELEKRNQETLQSVLEAAAKGTPAPGSTTQKVGDFYASCMDDKTLDAQGLDPLRLELGRINAVIDAKSLAEEIAHLHNEGVEVLFSAGPSQDLKNSGEMILDLLQGGLGMPDRDHYLKDDEPTKKIRAEYRRHVEKMLALSGQAVADAAAEKILALETRLAKASKTRAERRDVPGNYHRMKLAEIAALTPHFPWPEYLAGIGLPGLAEANVRSPAFFAAADEEVARFGIQDWRLYLRWHLLNSLAPHLAAAFVEEDFHFKGTVLHGTGENRPRWQRCVRLADASLGEALGEAYVAAHFSPAAKARALALVDNLIAVLQEELATLPWMAETTRGEAKKKLAAFHKKIGYPDRWVDYSTLAVVRGAHLDNVLAALRFESRRQLAQVGKPVDRDLWEISPPTVNAFYNPSMNEVVFPAGILQPPFFDPGADDAWSYGAIGAAIGHEMTHGFDDQGSQFDERGNLRNWWAPADQASFKARSRCVARQYGSFKLDGVAVNGELVLGESIADLGGLKIAYAAYRRSLAGKPRVNEAGFTPEQRFFLAFAEIWAASAAAESERLDLTTDPHPLPRFRVNGVVANLPEFAQAFHCKPGDPMVRPAGERCQIW